jgi:chemotaxis protein methyltransferase CheR
MTNDILSLVAERSGLVFVANRHVEGETGIARAMKRTGEPDRASYLQRVQADPSAFDDLVDELTVGETHFMRDPDQLDLVRREVFPPLLRRQAAGVPARVWSAGCATGEEAYSLAILLEQAALDEGAVVLGTDLSAAALAKARAGSYSDWSMRGVSDGFRSDYFRHVRGRRVVVDRIRGKVRFERLNLVAQDDYASAGAYGMDLILCRNVLIYFAEPTVARIATRLFSCLAEGGVLLTAGADRLLGEYAPFEVEVSRVGLVYRRPARRLLPPPVARTHSPPVSVAAGPWLPARPPATAVAPEAGREAFLEVMAAANEGGAVYAEGIAQAALGLRPLDAHLHYLRATLLLALGRDEEAEAGALRALYLDRSLAVGHFLLGTVLRKRGARAEALRAFRNVRDLCAARPPDEQVAAGAGEPTSALRSAASFEVDQLEGAVG